LMDLPGLRLIGRYNFLFFKLRSIAAEVISALVIPATASALLKKFCRWNHDRSYLVRDAGKRGWKSLIN
jgi:hypothetical protein